MHAFSARAAWRARSYVATQRANDCGKRQTQRTHEPYAKAAKAGGQPDNYFTDRKVFAERLARDIAAKERLLKKMGLAR